MLSKLLNFSLILLKMPVIDNSTKGTIIGFAILIDALLFAFALSGKTKDGTIANWPAFWLSVVILIGIVVIAQY